MKVADTTGLTPEQRARLAYALSLIRSSQGDLRGWSQSRTATTVYLLKRRRGTLEQVYHVCQGEPLPSA